MRAKTQFYLYLIGSIAFALGVIWIAARYEQPWQVWRLWFFGAGAVIWGILAFQHWKMINAPRP
jgi:hypothetical protein